MTRGFALRYLWARKLRTLLTSLSIVLGVMMVTGTYVFTDTIDSSFEQIFTESNENIDAVVTATETVDAEGGSEPAFDAGPARRGRETEGVALAEGAIADPSVAIIGSDGEPTGSQGAPTFAFSTGDDLFDPLDYEGRPPESDDEIVIDARPPKTRGSGSATWSRSRQDGGERVHDLGIGKLGEVDSFGGASFTVLTLPEAQRIAGKEGEFDQIRSPPAEGVSPRPSARLKLAHRGGDGRDRRGERRVPAAPTSAGFGFLTTALLIFAGVSLFVAAFLIFNTFSITVAQRTREFGMLRTLGANRRQIVGSVILEALRRSACSPRSSGSLSGSGSRPCWVRCSRRLRSTCPSPGR